MRLHLAQIMRRRVERPKQAQVSPLLAEDTEAHLCNHRPDALGDTQGCPRWPACLRLEPLGGAR